MPSIWKRLTQPKAEPYQFLEAEELVPETPPPEPPETEEDLPDPLEQEIAEAAAIEEEAPDPVSFAQVQADRILQDAQRQADALLAEALDGARRQTDEIHEAARREGFEAGRAEGIQTGFAQAMEESRLAREKDAAALAAEVQKFLDQAGRALDRQLDSNVAELRDLALTVAEKVISVSLKSSSEVIGRMIQTAVDRRKRREWVRIYIAECDAKHLAQMPASLVSALNALSERVRIIPMADDEPGTCIIEMPDEIVDASAATQLNNIRNLLSDTPVSGAEIPRRSGHVSTDDPPDL
ncbi:MAG: F0F1 ATP synthase subunit delta [Oscillibacter sp.]|nr:F0F1 ATP synthase subunit delta [Oscillibacter sp.]